MSSLSDRKAAHEVMVVSLEARAATAGLVKDRGVQVVRQYGLSGVDKVYIRLYNPETKQAVGGVPVTPSTNP